MENYSRCSCFADRRAAGQQSGSADSYTQRLLLRDSLASPSSDVTIHSRSPLLLLTMCRSSLDPQFSMLLSTVEKGRQGYVEDCPLWSPMKGIFTWIQVFSEIFTDNNLFSIDSQTMFSYDIINLFKMFVKLYLQSLLTNGLAESVHILQGALSYFLGYMCPMTNFC